MLGKLAKQINLPCKFNNLHRTTIRKSQNYYYKKITELP